MATVLHGDSHFATAMAYGGIQNSMRDYVQREIERSSGIMTGIGQVLFQKAVECRDQFVNSNAFRLAEAAVRQFQCLWGQNEIQALQEIWKVQNAPLVMQRFLMANPTVRTLHLQQRVDAYSGSYFDVQPNAIGVEHDDYCRVMQGMIQSRDDDEAYITRTIDEPDEIVPLSFDQQVTILEAWGVMDQAVADGVDPTSRWNDDLG